jgi:hypothetical protein
MGAMNSTPSVAGALRNLTSVQHTVVSEGRESGSRTDSAFITCREMQRLLESHERSLRSLTKSNRFRKGNTAFKSSVNSYSAAVKELTVGLLSLFEALTKPEVGQEERDGAYWHSIIT